mmetsp:Transcript_10562/g.20885  ORF Transcript_10562/g.20885 Transcript_10562/m.20885 type:complete len:224 (-) Transcript_10562:195-866(-)
MGMIPGASSKSNSPPIRIHRSDRVTPGRGALSAILRPNKRLMRADLPTLGNPTTTALTGLGRSPRLVRFAFIFSLTCNACFTTDATPSPLFALVHDTECPLSLKNADHAFASSSLTISRRFRTITRGFDPTHLGIDGCLVDIGILPSLTSSTISTARSCSLSSCSALAICPGYHCTILTASTGLIFCSISFKSGSSSGALTVRCSKDFPRLGRFAQVTTFLPL